MHYEVMKYIPVVNERYFAVVLIRIEKKYLVAYKVAAREDGGIWISTASTKIGSINGKDQYMEAFRSDSSFENEEIRNFITNEVDKFNAQRHPSKSVFSPPTELIPHWQQNTRQPQENRKQENIQQTMPFQQNQNYESHSDYKY